MAEQQKIRIILTDKASLVLSDIVKKYGLQDTDEVAFQKMKAGISSQMVIINSLAADFASGMILNKDLTNSLQKYLEVSRQTAEGLCKEIITNLVPLLDKIPEEKFETPVIKEEFFREPSQGVKADAERKKDMDVFPVIKPLTRAVEQTEKNIQSQMEKSGDDSVLLQKKIPIEEFKKKISQTSKSSGPDNYREPIE